jgi:hypothetical protein
MVIGVGAQRAEKAGAMRRPLRLEVADGHEVHRGKAEGGIDIAESVGAGPDETDAQLAGVFVLVSDGRDKPEVSESFSDGLAIRRGEHDEEERFRRAEVGGTMPDVGRNGDGIPGFHFGLGAIGHRVADVALDDDEDFTAVGVIVAGIAAAGPKPAATHRDFAAVAERAAGVQLRPPQSKSSFSACSEGTN